MAANGSEIVGGGIEFGSMTNVKMQPTTNETAPGINLHDGRSTGDWQKVSLFSEPMGPQRKTKEFDKTIGFRSLRTPKKKVNL